MNIALLKQQEWAQPFLVLLSLAFAWLLPMDGLFLSYAILGPAHYLTQINWLHERQYFVSDKKLRIAFIGLLAVGAVITLIPSVHTLLFKPLIAGTFLFAAVIATGLSQKLHVAILLPLCLVFGTAIVQSNYVAIFVGTLLLTIVHVAFFTLCFVLSGVRKNGGMAGKVTIGLWIAATALLFLYPPELRMIWPETVAQGYGYFKTTLVALGADTTASATDAHNGWSSAFAFLAFAYTYHYLNWFSKTELLKWHLVSRQKITAMVIIYVGLILLYAHSFTSGILGSLFLATLHIVAEFPLDMIVVKSLFSRNKQA